MNMRNTLIFNAILLLAVLLSHSCIGEWVSYVKTKHYASAYVIANTFDPLLPSQEGLSDTCNFIMLSFSGNRVTVGSDGEKKDLFDKIALENGDTGWKDYLDPTMEHLWETYLYPDGLTIEVTSNVDFDTQHPAGTSLNDCVYLQYSSAYDFVHSGYNPEKTMATKQSLLSDLALDDLRMLRVYPYPRLIFAKLPEIKGVHEITIRIYFDNNIRRTKTVEVDFDLINL